jgi:hypothetical protein
VDGGAEKRAAQQSFSSTTALVVAGGNVVAFLKLWEGKEHVRQDSIDGKCGQGIILTERRR